MSEHRSGAALPAVIVALIALELLGIGTLALALNQSALARDREDALQAGQAARSAVARGLLGWAEKLPQRLQPGQSIRFIETLDSHSSASTEIERISPQLFILRTTGTLQRGGLITAETTSGFLVGALDLAAAAAAIPAAVGTAAPLMLMGGALVDGAQPAAAPAGWTACADTDPAARPSVAAAHSGLLKAGPGSELRGVPPVQLVAGARFDGIGPLDLATLLLDADRTETGSLDLGPATSAGRCSIAHGGNWGAPLDPTSPCGSYFPLIHAPGPLALRSGAGQGVLVVEGDLTIAPGAAFYGVILALGRVMAGEGAQISGALLIAESDRASIVNGSTIRLSDCAVSRALTSSPALNRPILRHGRRWLPTF